MQVHCGFYPGQRLRETFRKKDEVNRRMGGELFGRKYNKF